MTILITGSNGKTAAALAPIVAATHPTLVASRKGVSAGSLFPTTRFDFWDRSTFKLPFEHPLAKHSPITAIYLVAPVASNTTDVAIDFIKFANERGVKRFVLLSQADMDENTTHGYGPVHKYLKESGLEWAVLRPNFFMDNFSENYHYQSIIDQGKFYTAAGKGKLPFIAAADIAEIGRRALLDEKPHNRDYVIVGGANISYDEIAETMSEVLGRKIKHQSLSEADMAAYLRKLGLPDDFIADLLQLDVRASRDELIMSDNGVVKQVTGREPMTIKEYLVQNKHIWAKN